MACLFEVAFSNNSLARRRVSAEWFQHPSGAPSGRLPSFGSLTRWIISTISGPSGSLATGCAGSAPAAIEHATPPPVALAEAGAFGLLHESAATS